MLHDSIQQLPWMKDVLSHTDGYFSEILTNDHAYWKSQPNSGKRNALEATLQLADWLAANGKMFLPPILAWRPKTADAGGNELRVRIF